MINQISDVPGHVSAHSSIVSLRGCGKASPLRLSMLQASGKTRKVRSDIATKRPCFEGLR
ncbi:hypothetical protein [Baia soyae]|uniref:hypothetical protein n=1 Tax=Baia soyae TaxID=1544746 RepID=UPI001051FDB6|nr:hypothetical protein [Baia soyae]